MKIGAIICVLAAVAAPLVPAAEKDPLTFPLSPGSVALLVERSTEPAVQARWREALSDKLPEVRAAAARVINVSACKALIPDVKAALRREDDGDAAAEETWVLGAFDQSAEADEVILDAAKRLETDGRGRVLAAFRVASGSRLFAKWSSVRWLDLTEKGWRGIFKEIATGDTGSLAVVVPQVLRDGPDVAWRALLSVADPGAVEKGPLAVALESGSSAMRSATYEHLVRAAIGDRPIDVPLPAAAPSDPLESFWREILRRLRGEAPADLRDVIASLKTHSGGLRRALFVPARPRIVRVLTPDESRALATVLDVDLEVLTRQPPEAAARRALSPAPPDVPLRTPKTFPRGFVADVLAVARCKGLERLGAGAEVQFGPNGRPRTISFMPNALDASCNAATRALLFSSLNLRPRSETTRLLIPTTPRFLTCLAAPPSAAAGGQGGDEPFDPSPAIKEPKRVASVPPVYPMSARNARVSGTVILEATLSDTGCVHDIALERSVDVSLDWSAIEAVAGWAYSPTLLRGRPVPVIMTVTVNFKLN